MSALRIYVDSACPACARARRIAALLADRFPQLPIEMVNITEQTTPLPDMVFAVPTFVLNDRVLSLGTPDLATLTTQIDACLADELGANTS